MSYSESTYIPHIHKIRAQVWNLSGQFYRSKGDCLARNFVSTLPYAVILEKRNIKVEEVYNVWK